MTNIISLQYGLTPLPVMTFYFSEALAMCQINYSITIMTFDVS